MKFYFEGLDDVFVEAPFYSTYTICGLKRQGKRPFKVVLDYEDATNFLKGLKTKDSDAVVEYLVNLFTRLVREVDDGK